MSWTWRDLGRAIKAARWAFHHADDLTMLKHELEHPPEATWDKVHQQHYRSLNWLAQRFLGSLPIR